ncbi:phosphonate metabolism protein/1,5-bisphosphokinase (PRPP-forming) PhnN [Piscinibacter sp.]|uniref:phosphonate metabolism protein/1,5-bisphosphokinase (PRPP-forming) PhnN n=1 Tax=Piscinibacter sp. TaxID=1903157 RepID=UPI002B77094C|nr:phosphonate metabolism protein/1,5-bisphosphokinase (PRPP-forming) PhnN [Albitalea sp.]HUG21294.1 phosphonate metabolism protein/1,5-bisphosphokinase (PRPP-forming) PhnN [Albitalea sp.]
MRASILHSQRLIVVVGPSGAGKDSVLGAWRQRVAAQRVHFAQRVITRPCDASEAHEPVTLDQFTALRDSGELATCWHANGLHYGLRWREIAALSAGGWVVVNGSRAHLGTLRQQAPLLHAIEITASAALRAQRLARRGREDAAAVAKRLQRHVPVEVAIAVRNDGELSAAVDALHRWWRAQAVQPASDGAFGPNYEWKQ